jgi:hypothetical protein
MTTKSIISAVILATMLCGCKVKPIDTEPKTAGIKTETGNIVVQADKIDLAVKDTPDVSGTVKDMTGSIRMSAFEIDGITADLDKHTQELIANAIKWKATAEKLQAKIDQMDKSFLRKAQITALLAFGGCIAGYFFTRIRELVYGAIGSGGVFILTMWTAKYLTAIYIATSVSVVLVILILARKAYVYIKASREVVKFVQDDVKPDMADSKTIFKRAESVYSDTTKAIVSAIKKGGN